MTEPKFTPAPWAIAQSDYFNEATNSHLVVKTEGRDEWEICHLCDGINGSIGETMIANGRLIAQAPAMYAKLFELSKALKKYGYEATHEEIERILAAARGEEKQPTT